jgi:hypothetical protein
MSKQTDKPRFIFHGNAMPFGGRIVNIAGKPFLDTIPGAPSAALTVAGGRSRATSRGSSYRDFFRWGATLADAKGELRADGHYITRVTSSITDFQAKNKPFLFEADDLRMTMVSDHYVEGQPTIIPTQTLFGGMRLDGKPLELEWDDDLASYPTFNHFQEKYRSDEGFFRKYRTGAKQATDAAGFGEPLTRTPGGFVAFSFVRRIFWNKKKILGNHLYLRGFGSLYFGEVLMSESNRRVTTVRLVMGCTVDAEVACAEADPNGTWGG